MKRILGLLILGWTIGCGGESAAPPDMTGTGMTKTCEATAADGVAVSTVDPYGGPPYALGYLPYAVDGCALAYVDPSGDLRLRDLATGNDTVLATADEAPRRPAINGDLVAWEASIDGVTQVRVRAAGSSATKTIAGSFHHAGEPRVALDTVVFTAWLAADDGGDTDVLLYTPSKDAVQTIASGPAQQRFADVSSTHVAWTDFAEDPDGMFSDFGSDAADVVVLDRQTGALTTRKQPGKQGFPMLGAEGKIAYLDWGLVHPEPKFSEYGIRLGPIDGDGSDDELAAHLMTQILYVRPVARGTRLSWVTTDSGSSVLLQRGVDLASPEKAIAVFATGSVYGPSAADKLTLVGASSTDGSVTLRAFAP
jgi:hypothetical protein